MTISAIKKRLKHGLIKSVADDNKIPIGRVRNVLAGKIKDKELRDQVISAFKKAFAK